MRKNILFLLILLAAPAVASAASGVAAPDTISARRAFLEMPVKVLDLLSREKRLDMLAFADADSVWYTTNEMDGLSALKVLTPRYAEVQITPVSTLEIKVLKNAKGGDMVMTIYTTGGDGEAKDSDIKFYDAAMRELETSKYFKIPALADFFSIPKGSTTKMKEIEELVPFYTVELSSSPDSDVLTGKMTAGEFLTLEDRKLVELFLKPQISWSWDGKNYKLIKQ